MSEQEKPKTLLVMRHAKSSWQEAGLSDFERPLNKRGRKAAPLMAETLKSINLVPELIVSSSAERARQTTDILFSQWNDPVETVLERSLYLAGPRQYLEAIKNHASGERCVMVVGHNPGLEHLIETLTREDEFMPPPEWRIRHHTKTSE